MLDQSNETNPFDDTAFVANLVRSVSYINNYEYYKRFYDEVLRLLKVNYCLKRHVITRECICSLYSLNLTHKQPPPKLHYIFSDALDRKEYYRGELKYLLQSTPNL